MTRILHASLRPFAAIAIYCLTLSLAAAQSPAAPTQPQTPASPLAPGVTNIGSIYGSGARQLITIYVKPFVNKGVAGADPTLEKTINNDLMLSGFFQGPRVQAFAEETNRLDQAKGTIQFAEWVRVGVFYLVNAEYAMESGQAKVNVRVYDTVSQQYVYGYGYPYEPSRARGLGHWIANDIIKRITGQEGVADTQILFIIQGDAMGRTKQVAMMDADGSNVRTLTNRGELAATPCWGAHGTEVYFTTYRDFNPDLMGMILNSRYQWWVSRAAGLNLSPAWCEANQRIALTMTYEGNSELYTVSREGKGRTRLTYNRAIDSSPAWSPDGTKIVFTSDRTGNPQIYVIDLNTREERRLTYEGNYNDAASWSPDGKYIAYHSRRDGEFQVCLMSPDGSGNRVVTEGEDPSWAPNSLLLAFASKRNGASQIYSMFADGTNVRQLSHVSGGAQSPSWSPARAKSE